MKNMFNKVITFLVPFLPKIFVRLFSNKYIAGINHDQALKIIKRLNDKNFLSTIDILGEHTKSIDEANLITNEYISLYKEIKSRNLNCNISIKPSHIGADISEDIFLKNLEKIHSHSISCDNFLRIDKEKSIEIFKNGGWHFNNVMKPNEISKKLKTFAHKEFSKKEFSSPEIIEKKISKKIDLFDRGHKYKVINLNKKFPDYILNNLKNLKEFIA